MLTMKTYTKETLEEADQSWLAGGFGGEWQQYRTLAAERGFLYPPHGESTDQWDNRSPSQRAAIYRAIDETPQLLVEVVSQSMSWSEVVAGLIRWRDRRIAELNVAETTQCPMCGHKFRATIYKSDSGS